MDALNATPLEHHLIKTNGITLHAIAAGPVDGPLVVLLHGFPEFWYGWRHQIPALAAAGYRVVVPDQRGFNESDKPDGIASYAVMEQVGDLDGLIRAFGRDRAALVGHDFGANAAWWTVLTRPHLVERLGILNVPHPRVYIQALRGNLRQLLKSWYILAAQLPWIPEMGLSRNDFVGMTRALLGSAKPTTFTTEELGVYRDSWRHQGALNAMLNWYRAAARYQPKPPAIWRVTVPALIIWGKQDVALEASLAQESLDLCDNGRLVMYDDATHWVQHDAAEQVNMELLAFLGER